MASVSMKTKDLEPVRMGDYLSDEDRLEGSKLSALLEEISKLAEVVLKPPSPSTRKILTIEDIRTLERLTLQSGRVDDFFHQIMERLRKEASGSRFHWDAAAMGLKRKSGEVHAKIARDLSNSIPSLPILDAVIKLGLQPELYLSIFDYMRLMFNTLIDPLLLPSEMAIRRKNLLIFTSDSYEALVSPEIRCQLIKEHVGQLHASIQKTAVPFFLELLKTDKTQWPALIGAFYNRDERRVVDSEGYHEFVRTLGRNSAHRVIQSGQSEKIFSVLFQTYETCLLHYLDTPFYKLASMRLIDTVFQRQQRVGIPKHILTAGPLFSFFMSVFEIHHFFMVLSSRYFGIDELLTNDTVLIPRSLLDGFVRKYGISLQQALRAVPERNEPVWVHDIFRHFPRYLFDLFRTVKTSAEIPLEVTQTFAQELDPAKERVRKYFDIVWEMGLKINDVSAGKSPLEPYFIYEGKNLSLVPKYREEIEEALVQTKLFLDWLRKELKTREEMSEVLFYMLPALYKLHKENRLLSLISHSRDTQRLTRLLTGESKAFRAHLLEVPTDPLYLDCVQEAYPKGSDEPEKARREFIKENLCAIESLMNYVAAVKYPKMEIEKPPAALKPVASLSLVSLAGAGASSPAEDEDEIGSPNLTLLVKKPSPSVVKKESPRKPPIAGAGASSSPLPGLSGSAKESQEMARCHFDNLKSLLRSFYPSGSEIVACLREIYLANELMLTAMLLHVGVPREEILRLGHYLANRAGRLKTGVFPLTFSAELQEAISELNKTELLIRDSSRIWTEWQRSPFFVVILSHAFDRLGEPIAEEVLAPFKTLLAKGVSLFMTLMSFTTHHSRSEKKFSHDKLEVSIDHPRMMQWVDATIKLSPRRGENKELRALMLNIDGKIRTLYQRRSEREYSLSVGDYLARVTYHLETLFDPSREALADFHYGQILDLNALLVKELLLDCSPEEDLETNRQKSVWTLFNRLKIRSNSVLVAWLQSAESRRSKVRYEAPSTTLFRYELEKLTPKSTRFCETGFTSDSTLRKTALSEMELLSSLVESLC